ncbi:Hypothetical protein CINCED_3A008695 [Cinara cedri]|uniref:Uncharacterized protein n=1 Tax=Cinara cedri TaxID=506608 RepID=A0A5E4NIZ7_9HEMI|nr:Hypothetical protein CINCED_3A008695 [Cinara cedri]
MTEKVLDEIENDTRMIVVCKDDVCDRVKWKLGQGWLTPNSWDEGEEEEEL